MSADFDKAAPAYDQTFTHSQIGQLQRKYVYVQLAEALKTLPPGKILEINCGTGEDALWLADHGFRVTATDISEKMLAVAKSKSDSENPAFMRADINRLSGTFPAEKFAMLFSNFGGLNCLDKKELSAFFETAHGLLTENGRLILVIMPENTLWERLYFLFKGQFSNISRRKKAMAIANVNGEKVATYYHNPKETVTLAGRYFEPERFSPIGFFVPPSYLEPFFSRRKRLLSLLNGLEKRISGISFLSKYADHYCIVFQKK